MCRIVTLLLLVILSIRMDSQTSTLQWPSRLGQFYVYWGYNRAYYNRSDIHFKGEGYDFTLERASAEDMPEKFDPKVYFSPTQLTVPQFNFRLGYYIRNQISLSLGWDHMKYRLVPTQYIRINGRIDPELYPVAGYNGDFHHNYILYHPGFMNYHHSDGFNFVRLAVEKTMTLVQPSSRKWNATMHGGCSVGFMLPWTDFTLFGKNFENKPHISGIGASVNAGARFNFWKYYFLQVNAQVGWTRMNDILLQWPSSARASQKIVFIERSWALGGYIPWGKKTKSVTTD